MAAPSAGPHTFPCARAAEAVTQFASSNSCTYRCCWGFKCLAPMCPWHPPQQTPHPHLVRPPFHPLHAATPHAPSWHARLPALISSIDQPSSMREEAAAAAPAAAHRPALPHTFCGPAALRFLPYTILRVGTRARRRAGARCSVAPCARARLQGFGQDLHSRKGARRSLHVLGFALYSSPLLNRSRLEAAAGWAPPAAPSHFAAPCVLPPACRLPIARGLRLQAPLSLTPLILKPSHFRTPTDTRPRVRSPPLSATIYSS